MEPFTFPFARFREIPLKRIKARGHLLAFLQRQKSGLSGNYERSGYPFDTQMWTGERITPFFKEHEYKGKEKEVPSTNSWWPYEQVSYLLDGLLKLGILLDSGKEQELFRKNLDALLQRKDASGRMGLKNYGLDNEWPFAVFFRAVKCYWENQEAPEELIETFRKHYHAVEKKDYTQVDRGVTNIEGMLITALLAKDDSLIRKAEEVYLETSEYCVRTQPLDALFWDEIQHKENIVRHGVTLSEELKLPVLLYLATGKSDYLEKAEEALERILRYHEQPCGLPSSNEYGVGKDPLQGYESCVITDFAWALGYFLMAAGKGRYADRIEKITYNALPGSITKDFTLLQYFSSVNQFISTPFSNHSLFLRGHAPLRQFRPDHFAACCPGNIHRAMPNFVSRMWLEEKETSSPVAAFYGPSEASFRCKGSDLLIREETSYPFEEKITFHFSCSAPVVMPFTFRIPEWCRTPEVICNGEKLPLPSVKEGFAVLERSWQDGDTLILEFPAECRIRKDRQWCWVERGPLLYALDIPAKMVREREGDRFSPISLTPAGEWAYALEENAPLTVEKCPSSYPYEEPAIRIKATGKKIHNYALDQARFTPQVPLFYQVAEKEEPLTLVPFGTTLLRALCFPDTVERKMVPILSAKCTPPTAFDPLKDLAGELAKLPENAVNSEELFDSLPDYLEVGETGYWDLRKHFGKCENVMATLLVRFYLEEEREITICAGVSDGGSLSLNDQTLGLIHPSFSGEFAAPFFFPCRGRKGHNYLRIALVDPPTPEQYLHSWGANVTVFYK